MGGQRSKGSGRIVTRNLRRGTALLGVLLFGLSAWASLRAAEAPDDGLLEFLGSVDTADKDLRDYLARTDFDKAARRAARGSPAPVPDGTPPPPPAPPSSPPPDPTAGSGGKPVASQ